MFQDYTVIPFHINKPEAQADDAFKAYLDKDAGVIVGGVNDEKNILPFGFQVCNGAALQKIVKLANGKAANAADDSGENAPDYRGRFIIGGGHCASVENTDMMMREEDPWYGEDDFMGQSLLEEVLVQHALTEEQIRQDISSGAPCSRCDFDDFCRRGGAKELGKLFKDDEQQTQGTSDPMKIYLLEDGLIGKISTASRPNLRIAKGIYSDTNVSLVTPWRNTR